MEIRDSASVRDLSMRPSGPATETGGPRDSFERGAAEPVLMDPARLREMTQSDRDLDDPLPAISRPGTHRVVDEMRDHSNPLPPDAERTFGHRRVDGAIFTDAGNWRDIGTAVAADQLAGMTERQLAEFTSVTGAKPEEITAGDASLMQVAPTEDWESMPGPRPPIEYREIDYSRIGPHPIEPRWLVMHYTAAVDDTPESVWQRFHERQGIPSTQFIVGKDGRILQIMPETQKCQGTLFFNNESLQIEVCGNFRLERETDAEFESTLALVKYLQKKYHIPDTQIISHRQVDSNFGRPGRKPDPGFRFMNRLYEALR